MSQIVATDHQTKFRQDGRPVKQVTLRRQDGAIMTSDAVEKAVKDVSKKYPALEFQLSMNVDNLGWRSLNKYVDDQDNLDIRMARRLFC